MAAKAASDRQAGEDSAVNRCGRRLSRVTMLISGRPIAAVHAALATAGAIVFVGFLLSYVAG